MRTIVLDGGLMTTREEAYDHLTARLGLPAEFGRNLDALYDVLAGDLPAPTRLTIRRPAALKESLGTYGAALLRTLEDAAAENPALQLVCGEDGER